MAGPARSNACLYQAWETAQTESSRREGRFTVEVARELIVRSMFHVVCVETMVRGMVQSTDYVMKSGALVMDWILE
jgi:hypothetical protein